ncbi:MAG: tRNA pseudouridine(55) synthase TruB [Clostridioides sp.]|jgi:tRNA pseudouridine55 synthase|nr:tRNA pseudouridine(55) synthase TruB [Clostridioides sp.]
MNKVVNILKPTGMTSHDVVSQIRKITRIKKVGHTGTLDPDASGVLPICIGSATKISEFILNKDKEYFCEMTLGISTDTYDSSGKIVCKKNDGMLKIQQQEILNVFEKFTGEIEQFPPIYSALKVNGKKMCDLARSGREDEIELKSRKIKISNIELIRFEDNKVCFLVKCSKGTYIRSLCNDIGKELGCGAYMSLLIRTASGIFTLKNTMTIEEFQEYYNNFETENKNSKCVKGIIDIEDVFCDFSSITIHDNAVKYYSNGGTIDERRFIQRNFNEDDVFVKVYSKDSFLGIGKLRKEKSIVLLKNERIF